MFSISLDWAISSELSLLLSLELLEDLVEKGVSSSDDLSLSSSSRPKDQMSLFFLSMLQLISCVSSIMPQGIDEKVSRTSWES